MKKHVRIFWPLILTVVFSFLYALSVYDFYSPNSVGIDSFLYVPSAAFCFLLCPVIGGMQALYFVYRFSKTRERHYFYHLYSSLLVELCSAGMFILATNGFYITV